MTQVASVDFNSSAGAVGGRSRRATGAIASAASKWLVPALGLGASGFGLMAADTEISFLRAIAGFVVGGGVGLALGLANGLSKLSENLTNSALQMIRNVPHLALIPLVIVWFGIDEGAKLFLVALGVFFPLYVNTLHGVRSVDPQLIEMARSYGMSNGALFRRVICQARCPPSSSGFAMRLASCGRR